MSANENSRNETCGLCGVTLDWTGADRRRAAGLIEDGSTICVTCENEVDRIYDIPRLG